MTTEQWQDFLKTWSSEWLATKEHFPPRVRKSGWLGNKPATKSQVMQLQSRLGFELPPSYRNFLLVSNGWSRTSDMISKLRSVNQVQWLETDDPQLLDVWAADNTDDAISNFSLADYFAYDGRPIFDREHFRKSLVIADPVPGDSMIYVLNPMVVASNGEWEAWRFANWIPGAERFPSFELLMRAEHASFHLVRKNRGENVLGPYAGPYSPDQPRHEAVPIGRAKIKSRRLTIPELIGELESQNHKTRLAAAKQLFREFRPHQSWDEHPELIEPLTRILASDAEPDVRGAAAAMLGTYGDSSAIPPLLKAIDDPSVMYFVLNALFYLCIDIKDQRVADSLVGLIEQTSDYYILDKVVNILKDLKDPRVASLGLRLLDGELGPKFSDAQQKAIARANPDASSPGEAIQFALDHQTSSLRFAGAFAFAEFENNPAPALIARLSHENAQVRTAAVAALREVAGKGPHLADFVSPLLEDPDPIVQQQAATTIRSLQPLPQVEISPERLAEIQNQVSALLQKAANRRPRF